MNMQGLLILAVDWGTVIAVVVWLLFMLGGWLGNQQKEAKKRQDRLNNQTTQPRKLDGSTSVDDQKMTASQLAQKRREQLQQLAQQRQTRIQSQSGQGNSSRMQPNNISPSEARRRELAKTEYERRADELRQQAEQYRQQRARQREIAKQRAQQQLQQQQRQAQVQSQRRQAQQGPPSMQRTGQQQLQRMSQRTVTRPPQPARTVSPQTQRAARATAASAEKPIVLEETARRSINQILQQADEPEQKVANAALNKLRSDQSIRNAVIWKELLDKPLALREQL